MGKQRKSATPAVDRSDEIRAEIASRRITSEQAGMSLDELAAAAASQEDIGVYLDLFGMSPISDTQEGAGPATTETSIPADGDPTSLQAENGDGDRPSPQTATTAADAGSGDTWIEETSVTGPGVVTLPPGMKELFDITKLPWRDPESLDRLPGCAFRIVETPAIEPPRGQYLSRHVDVNGLTPDQAYAWRQLFLGLDKFGVRLANGRRVTTQSDAIRWLLEQLR